MQKTRNFRFILLPLYFKKTVDMAIELYLIRHGETEENAAGILQGHLPGHLNDKGKEQARQTAEDLQDIPFDIMYCSDLKRCADTAAIINERLHLPIHYSPLLRERDWGPLTGKKILCVRAMIDEEAESVESMFSRARTFLTEMVQQEDGHTVLIVSHGLFCRVLQGACTGKTIRDIPRMDNAEVRHLTLTPPYSFAQENEETGVTAD
jgi:probable phosphoglycerate mutase